MPKSDTSKRKRSSKKSSHNSDVYIPIRSELDIIEDLRTLANLSGFIHEFTYLIFKSNIVTTEREFTKDDFLSIYDKTSLLRTEANLLLALMLSAPVLLDVPTTHETAEHISQTLNLLEELHQSIIEPGRAAFHEALLAHFSSKENKPNLLRNGAFLREAFFYGSESAFPFQYLEFAKKRYIDDAGWLRENVGFSIHEAVSVMSAIRASLTDRLPKIFDEIRGWPPNEWTFLPLFQIDIDDVVLKCGLERSVIDQVISKFESRDGCYIEIKNVSQFNPVNSYPIARLCDGKIYAFLEYSLCECVYESPFYWIIKDKVYFGAHSQYRGIFLEKIIDNLLKSVFKSENIYRNVIFKSSKDTKCEADIILVHGDRAFVFQAKSKRLTEQSKLGSESAIETDFSAAVQSAYDQAVDCIECLKSGIPASVDGKIIPQSNFSEIKEYYPVCITSEHYPALAHQSRAMLKYSESNYLKAPLVFDIFTLDVIIEFLNKPLYFIDYMVKRSISIEKVFANHEMVVLSWYIKKNLHFDDQQLVYLEDDILIEVDLAMAVRRLGIEGPSLPTGQLTRFYGTPIQRILDAVNASNRPEVHRLGELLIGLGSDTADTLNDGITKIIAMTRGDGAS